MDKALNQQLSPYRWLVLAIVALIHLALNFIVIQPGGLAGMMIPQLHLQPSQFAMNLMVPFLTGAVFGIPSGALADRYGVKNVVAIGLVLCVMGCFWRIGAGNFGSLFWASFIMGFGLATLNANASKLLGAWFPVEQMGVAMGVYIASATLGVAITLGTGALFPSIRSAFLLSAVAMTIMLILWVFLIRNKPAGAPDIKPQPVMDYLRVVVKNKYIWIAGLAMIIFVGFGATQNGFLVNSLVQVKKADPVAAGLVASTVNLAVIVGSILWPWVCSKVGVIKKIIVPVAVLSGVASYIGFNLLPFGTGTFVSYALVGIFVGGGAPIVMAMPMLLDGIGPEYAGTGGGVISALMNLGSFFLSSYIIVPLAGGDAYRLFLYVALGDALFGLVICFLPELGEKARAKTKALQC